jgi:hypothetical protein
MESVSKNSGANKEIQYFPLCLPTGRTALADILSIILTEPVALGVLELRSKIAKFGRTSAPMSVISLCKWSSWFKGC